MTRLSNDASNFKLQVLNEIKKLHEPVPIHILAFNQSVRKKKFSQKKTYFLVKRRQYRKNYHLILTTSNLLLLSKYLSLRISSKNSFFSPENLFSHFCQESYFDSGYKSFRPTPFQPLQFQPLQFQPFTVSTVLTFNRWPFRPLANSTACKFNRHKFDLFN